jgi:hypothetical protein
MPRRPRSVFVSYPGRNACCGGISLSGARRPGDHRRETDPRHRGQGPGHLQSRARVPPTQPPNRTTNPQVAGRFRRSNPIEAGHQAARASRFRTEVEAEAAKQQLPPTVRGVAGKIERAFGALFASLPSGIAMAPLLVASHEAGIRPAIDLLAPHHRANNPHRPFAAGAKQRVLAPHFHDEVAPQRTQGAGAFWFGCGKREKCRIRRGHVPGLG